MVTSYGEINKALIGKDSAILSYVSFLSVFGTCLFLASKRPFQKLYNPLSILVITIFLLMSLMSAVLHSVSWGSYTKLAASFVTLLIAFSAVSFFSIHSLVKVFFYSCFSACALSILLMWMLPDIVIHSNIHEGSLKGIYEHKNNLGWVASFGLMIAVFCFIFHKKNLLGMSRLIIAITMAVMLLASYKAGSGGAIITLFLCFFLLVLISILKLLKEKKAVFFIVPFLFVCSLILTSFFISVEGIGSNKDALVLMGYEVSFSGRLTIWEFAVQRIKESPFIGYGYNNFWGEGHKSDVRDIGLGSIVLSDAHNGFIDLALEYGMVVFFLFFIFLCFMIGLFFKYSLYCSNGLILLAFLVFIVFLNFSESTFTKSLNSFFFAWCVLVFYSCSLFYASFPFIRR